MDLVIRVFLPASVGIIMLSLGLGLSIKDFTRIARWPKSFFVGTRLSDNDDPGHFFWRC